MFSYSLNANGTRRNTATSPSCSKHGKHGIPHRTQTDHENVDDEAVCCDKSEMAKSERRQNNTDNTEQRSPRYHRATMRSRADRAGKPRTLALTTAIAASTPNTQ